VQGKVLLLSQRRIADLVAYCLAYEFEDSFAAVTNAERIDATDLPGLEFSRRAYKLMCLASGSPRLACRLAPYPRSKVVLERDFESFFRCSVTPMNYIRSRRFPTGASAAARRPASSPMSDRDCCRKTCSSYYLPLTTSFLEPATASMTWHASPAARALTCRSLLTCPVSHLHRSKSRARSMSATSAAHRSRIRLS
jgi:hypothetical protein